MVKPGWDAYKAVIIRLYIDEDKSREEVVNFMATEYSWKKRYVSNGDLAPSPHIKSCIRTYVMS